MSIKSTLEQAIKTLETEKEREVSIIKDRTMREKIIPYNQEMDIMRDKAVAEKQSALNATIAAHQEQFVKEKKEIFDAAEKKKSENASAVLATETYAVTGIYDKEISYLKERVANIKES